MLADCKYPFKTTPQLLMIMPSIDYSAAFKAWVIDCNHVYKSKGDVLKEQTKI